VIVHDPDDWLARVDDRVRNRLSGQELGLDRYGVSELADILQARARVGLRTGVIGRECLEAIADEVAGVAREGVQSLRAAAEVAGERGHARIRERDVADAYGRARRRIREAALASLPFHHQVLYAVLYQAGTLDATALHDRYDAVAKVVYSGRQQVPLSKRARRNKLSKLRDYDLICYEGPPQRRVYTIVDEKVPPPISIDATV